MSRKYGRVEVKVWHDEKFRSLSPTAQLMFLYCLTSPHSTAWGAYILPDLYIEADLNLSKKAIKAGWAELIKQGLVLRCKTTNMVAFVHWFRYNPPQNADTAKSCINGLNALPKSPILSTLYKESEWISEQLANYSLTPLDLRREEIEIEIEKEIEIEIDIEMQDSQQSPAPQEPNFFEINPKIQKFLQESSYFKVLAEPTKTNMALFESAVGLEEQHKGFEILKALADADVYVSKRPQRYAFARATLNGAEPKPAAARTFLGNWFSNAVKFLEER